MVDFVEPNLPEEPLRVDFVEPNLPEEPLRLERVKSALTTFIVSLLIWSISLLFGAPGKWTYLEN